jgi:hypothetical protein
MTANDWPSRLLVKIDRAHNADTFTLAAANTPFRFQQHPASATLLKSMARAYFHTRGLPAPKAHNRDITAGHTAGCTHFDGALYERMVLLVYG